MAKKFLTPINLTGNEIQNVVGQNLASAPSSPAAGQFYYDTGLHQLLWYNGSTWIAAQGGSPTGSAGGDLTGTYPSPTIAATAVTGTKINAPSVGAVLHLQGLASARPTAAAGNTGLYYFATDTNGGTLYQNITGSTWTQVALGVSQSTTPNGSAGGDLTGTYPNPTIGAGKVTSANTNASSVGTALLLTGTFASRPTASGTNSGLYYWANDTNGGTLYQNISGSAWTQITRGLSEVELLANKGAASGYASLDSSTFVTFAQLPVASSGTTSSTKIVRADDSRLSDTRTPTAASIVDSMVSASAAIAFTKLATPTADVAWGSHKITGLLDPTGPQDAATKNYVDTMASGLDFKASVRAATTANITLSAPQTIDGVSVIAGDRVLVKNQTTANQNGIYVVAAGAWARSSDMNTTANTSAGALVYVEGGTVNGGQQWILSTTGAITVGTTSIAFTQFSGASVATAGNGLTATGNVLAVGAGTGISVAADAVSIDTSVVVQKFAAAVGDGSSTSITVTHNLGTQDVTVSVYTNGSPWDEVQCDVQHATTNTVILLFSTAPTSNAYRCVVHG